MAERSNGPRVGDTVEIAVTGKVMRVHDDGRVEVELEHGPRLLDPTNVVILASNPAQ